MFPSVVTILHPCPQILASGDSSGIVTIWSLDEENSTLLQVAKMEDWAGFPVTTLCIWNKYKEARLIHHLTLIPNTDILQGIVAAGYGSGHIRLFSIPDGRVLCEIAAHNGWITGMDLASQSGLLLSCAEDGYVRVGTGRQARGAHHPILRRSGSSLPRVPWQSTGSASLWRTA